MKRFPGRFGALLIGLLPFIAGSIAYGGGIHETFDPGRRYAITITNVTRGQVISPPLVIVHKKAFRLFTPGEAATPELAALAEDADTAPLIGLLPTIPSVLHAEVAPGPIIPGDSVTLTVTVKGPFRYITAAGMLVTSNDAFFAVEGERVSVAGKRTVDAPAYDAGSEENLEQCLHIPGPPCGNPFVRPEPNEPEGFVHIHAGIHGIGDLMPEQSDWRNPVAEVDITQVR
jgi:hypothetical protein